MHHIDLGLFKYMLDYTQDLLIKQCGNLVIKEFNNRLAAIPKFPGLKIFNNGITSVQTADEYRMVMKVIISIIDGIFDDDDPHIKKRKRKSKNPFISSTQLTSVYFSFICMYIMSRKEEFSEKDLTIFEVKMFCFICNLKYLNNCIIL
jgi:hypothetical protein